MLAAAALVPETALLVPGAPGAVDVLADVRAAALIATADLLGGAPDRVVVVASSTAPGDLVRTGPLLPTLTAAGIDDDVLGWAAVPTRGEPGETVVTVRDVPASVALLLLSEAGWSGEVHLLTVGSRRPPDLHALGARMVEGSDRVALLLSGSLSARRGPDGPLPDDARAAALDDIVLSDLADLGPAARSRLGDVPAGLAAELAVSAWAPWQVLLGAAPDGLQGRVRWAGTPFGATYAVMSWAVGPR